MANPSTPQSCLTCDSHKVCRFYHNHDELYSCNISNVSMALLSIGGDHEVVNGRTFTDADVKAVYFKDSILLQVPVVIFTRFPNIELLSIPSTKMTIIDDDTFKSCNNLKELDVSGNSISEVTKTWLQKCQKLETINFSGNRIKNFDTDLFKLNPLLKNVILIEGPSI
jgi:Leucine-rich repeat (LRR) protein